MVSHITFLVLCVVCMSWALEPKENDMKVVENVMSKYFAKLPNVGTKFVVNTGLSKMISSYYDGKVNAFPLFKISFLIDNKPIKIPWSLDQADKRNETKKLKKRYKYVRTKTSTIK